MKGIQLIQRWLRKGEGTQLDFKTTIASPWKIAKTIAAFANSRGGLIVVGIEDKGHIVGVEAEGEKYELERAATTFCRPAVPLQFEEIIYQNKKILIASIEESKKKPHYVLDKNRQHEELLIRIQDKCVEPPDFVRELLLSGELNVGVRSNEYYQILRSLPQHFSNNTPINQQQFQLWAKTSERNALRLLADYLLEGALVLKSKTPPQFVINNAFFYPAL